METEAFNEKADWAKTHKYSATLSAHSFLLFHLPFYLATNTTPKKNKQTKKWYFFHLAHLEGELIYTVKFYLGFSFIFFTDQKGKE